MQSYERSPNPFGSFGYNRDSHFLLDLSCQTINHWQALIVTEKAIRLGAGSFGCHTSFRDCSMPGPMLYICFPFS
eukprot:scaffold6806_cov122-Skeletonema_dohrnii-CCMP3373.AAC.7